MLASGSFAVKFRFSCSIGLYAINLIKVAVPEKHKFNLNHRIRRLTLNRVAIDAFSACLGAKPETCGSIRSDGPIPYLRSGGSAVQSE